MPEFLEHYCHRRGIPDIGCHLKFADACFPKWKSNFLIKSCLSQGTQGDYSEKKQPAKCHFNEVPHLGCSNLITTDRTAQYLNPSTKILPSCHAFLFSLAHLLTKL